VTCNYLQYSGDEYLMAFARDISLRKKAENDLKESKAEAELYLDLMSHDINNMNQIAAGYLELALDTLNAEGKLEKGQSELISKPHEMLANSSALIGNVRKIRKEKSGHYQPAVMDLCEIIQQVIGSHSQVPGRDITINFNQDGSCKVNANELLRDIFVNLIGNAIKHSTGTLTINIDLAREIEDGKAYCMVAVEDNGPGIPDEQKIRLFREITPDKAKARSKGLGLYLIKQLVHDFKGKFWVEDRVAGDHTKGARFVIMLPTAK
jgi:signal transduction histidine kinase